MKMDERKFMIGNPIPFQGNPPFMRSHLRVSSSADRVL
jgi:hypothetical protein